MYHNLKLICFMLCVVMFDCLKYPNEIVDLPIVDCDSGKIVIKVRTSAANPSHIYAEQFHGVSSCIARNRNKISINHGECGMTSERMENPIGTMHRICIAVQIHPLFVTESDRSYCAQCVYLDSNVVDSLEQNIAISEVPPNELDPQFDESSKPRCTYSIRKGSVDGPPVHFATIGDVVVHVWECQNENLGILVQNCHVEDLEGNKILIIDQNGCAIDQYLLSTPQYTPDLKKAFQETKVFKFADKTMTKFTCQIRLCMKNRDNGCQNLTPPSRCPTQEEREAGMIIHEEGKNAAVEKGTIISGANYAGSALGVGRAPTGRQQNGSQISFGGYRFGFRNRRELTVIANSSNLDTKVADEELRGHRGKIVQNNTSNQYMQELDVEEVIRVLDSPEDVQYYEARMQDSFVEDNDAFRVPSSTTFNNGIRDTKRTYNGKCMSTMVYFSLLGTFTFLIAIQAVALGLFMMDKWLLDRAISNKLEELTMSKWISLVQAEQIRPEIESKRRRRQDENEIEPPRSETFSLN